MVRQVVSSNSWQLRMKLSWAESSGELGYFCSILLKNKFLKLSMIVGIDTCISLPTILEGTIFLLILCNLKQSS